MKSVSKTLTLGKALGCLPALALGCGVAETSDSVAVGKAEQAVTTNASAFVATTELGTQTAAA